MAKKPSESLHVLIKSLSKSEKRYFRLQSGASRDDSKFLRLFELIDKQDDYDEKSILKEKAFRPAQFANLKAHLYQKILRALRDYSLSSIHSIEIRELVDEAQILFNKGLYQQCSKRLSKAEKMATSTDNLELQLEVLKWKKFVLTHTLDWEDYSYVDEVVEKVSAVSTRINNINRFSNLQAKLQALYRKTGYIKDEKTFKKIQKIFTSNLPEITEDDLSISEKIHLYHVYIGYYFFIQDFEAGYRYAKKWVALFQENKALIKPKLEFYIRGLNYLLIAQNKLNLYEDFVRTKTELRTLNKLHPSFYNENIRLKMLKYTFVHEFNRLFMTGEFDRGVELIERLSSGLEGFISQLDAHSRMILFYKTACLYFGNNNFQRSIYWLNKILNSSEADLREDVHGFARILNLICHYELGNYDLIPYYVRSTYRYLLKNEDLHLYQRLILKFLKALSTNMSHEELIERFESLRKKLIPLQDNPYEKRAFVYFDIISWLESKIYGQKIMDVIKEKSRRRIEEVAIA